LERLNHVDLVLDVAGVVFAYALVAITERSCDRGVGPLDGTLRCIRQVAAVWRLWGLTGETG
jgi:hypothetical protein